MGWIKELYDLPVADESKNYGKTIVDFIIDFERGLSSFSYVRKIGGGDYIFLGEGRKPDNHLVISISSPDDFPKVKLEGHQPHHAIVTRPNEDIYFHPGIKQVLECLGATKPLATISHDPKTDDITKMFEALKEGYLQTA